jgi:hypothetical protein
MTNADTPEGFERHAFRREVLGVLTRLETEFGSSFANAVAVEMSAAMITFAADRSPVHRTALVAWLDQLADDLRHDRSPEPGVSYGHA